jgi:hypothetical protein
MMSVQEQFRQLAEWLCEPPRPGRGTAPIEGGRGFRGAPGALKAESPDLQKAFIRVISGRRGSIRE